MSHQKTLQQERAASAWHAVEQVDQKHRDVSNEYGSLIRGLPAMIQTDGLGHTLAFLLAKKPKNKQHGLAYDHLSQWVCARIADDDTTGLLVWLLTQDSIAYRRATSESLAYLQWMKRFVEAQGWQKEED